MKLDLETTWSQTIIFYIINGAVANEAGVWKEMVQNKLPLTQNHPAIRKNVRNIHTETESYMHTTASSEVFRTKLITWEVPSLVWWQIDWESSFFSSFFFVRGFDEKMQLFWRCSYTQETLTDQTRVFAFLLRRKISRSDRFPWKALILAMIWNCGTSLMELQIYYF